MIQNMFNIERNKYTYIIEFEKKRQNTIKIDSINDLFIQ